MSKKTKKEKILAAYRKKIRMLEISSSLVESKIIKEKQKSDISPSPVIPVETEIKTINPPPTYFFIDLKKSLILVFIIIALEIGLYFVKLIK